MYALSGLSHIRQDFPIGTIVIYCFNRYPPMIKPCHISKNKMVAVTHISTCKDILSILSIVILRLSGDLIGKAIGMEEQS